MWFGGFLESPPTAPTFLMPVPRPKFEIGMKVQNAEGSPSFVTARRLVADLWEYQTQDSLEYLPENKLFLRSEDWQGPWWYSYSHPECDKRVAAFFDFPTKMEGLKKIQGEPKIKDIPKKPIRVEGQGSLQYRLTGLRFYDEVDGWFVEALRSGDVRVFPEDSILLDEGISWKGPGWYITARDPIRKGEFFSTQEQCSSWAKDSRVALIPTPNFAIGEVVVYSAPKGKELCGRHTGIVERRSFEATGSPFPRKGPMPETPVPGIWWYTVGERSMEEGELESILQTLSHRKTSNL